MSKERSGGVSATFVLLTIFVVLKLTDNIDWSWIWVLSPCWIPLGLAAVIYLFIYAPLALWEARRIRRARNHCFDAELRAIRSETDPTRRKW